MPSAGLQRRRRLPRWTIAWLSNRLIDYRFEGLMGWFRVLREPPSDRWLTASATGLQGLTVWCVRCEQGLRKLATSCWFVK